MAVPTAPTTLLYTGASQTGIEDGTYYTAENGAGIDAGSYTATLALKDKVNYVWDLVTPTAADQSIAWSIGPKPIAVSWGSVTSWEYDGQNHVPTAEATGVAGETVTLTVSGSQKDYSASAYTANAAISAVSGGQAKATNYTLTDSTEEFCITQRPVELTWGYTEPFTYDNTPKSVTASVTNAVGDDTFALSYSNNSKTDAGSYTATVTGLGNGNYTLVGATGTTKDWAIQKAPVSFTVTGNSCTYDAAAHTASVAQTSGESTKIATDKVAVTYKLPAEELSAATANKTDAGSYDVMVTLTDSNFKFSGQEDAARSFKVGTLTIAKKPITIQWKDLTHVYDANVKTPTFDFAGSDIVPGDAKMVSVVLATGQSKSAAGSYTVRAELDGTRAGNYVLTNPTGNFTIQRAPVTFTVSNNSVPHDSSSHTATVTAVISAEKYTVTYRDSTGNAVVEPTDAGSYDVYVAITDENYRHAGAADGVAQKIGVLTIYRTSEPANYTVTFEGGNDATGSTDALDAAQAETVRILPTCGFTVTGKHFTGWKYGSSVYLPGERFAQPLANITLTAQWTDNAYTIAGVVDQNNSPLSDVVVTLMLGSKQLSQATTDADGSYSFSDVLPGTYNLVANKNGVTQTILVEIVAANAENKNITMPSGKTNSVVEITAGSPSIVVGNLEQSFATTESNPCFNSNDDAVVDGGGTVEIKLTASATTTAVQPIEEAASGTVGLYLDITLTKTVTEANGTVNEPVKLTEAAELLKMVINLPGELQGKDSYTVYRVHNDVTESLTASPNAKGEYIEVNDEKTAITVYAKCFSSYAIGYATKSYGSTSTIGYTPIIVTDGHGTVTAAPTAPTYGQTVTSTVTPKTGYQLSSLVVTDKNGLTIALTQNGNGTYSFTQPAGAVTITASFRAAWNPFTDVTQSSWYHDAVRYVYEKGLMLGTDDTAFSPYLSSSRGMIATVFYRLEGEPAITETCPFDDVSSGAYYEKAITWAAANSIVEGYGNNKFGPDDNITREQMAVILWRYAKYKGYDATASADLSKFSDVGSISGYAANAISWANACELILGKGSGSLDPGGKALRCEVAAILYRFCEAFAA